ncbi:tyrosine-protein phosphatase non-receptor type 12-like isoform X3 [Lineus longissimus]|uniref:tyrosine-protein phosphatase non-receptor type 12-like isoform X3 n=1 Tax=Lineus longissimus TaxID=88925 RepID=UPI00315C5ADC
MSLKALLQKFLDQEQLFSSEDNPFHAEFLELRDFSRQLNLVEGYEALAGATEENIKKNRYKDIRPFDTTRVCLPIIPGLPGSDYINANFIRGHHGGVAYIASQGPMPHTVDDFWAMLWKYEIKVVIMACNEREGGKAKCERYWAYSGEEKSFRGITVKLKKEENICEDFCKRHLVARKGTEERCLQQFHYINWPDHGAPESCSSLLEMVAKMRVDQPGDSPPIVIHCSAGCGRTGTICAVDYAWNVLKSGALTEDFNIKNIILEMRKQRPSIVQSKDQYILVHQAIAELFERHLSMIKDHLYENVMLEGSGRPIVEDSIYEDVGSMNKDESFEEDIYVNADELPIKCLSSPTSEKMIRETIENMVTDEDDETPDKVYSVSRALSKINAKTPSEEKVKVCPGPPALPVKKSNLPEQNDDRRSEPILNSTADKLPAKRKFSFSSLKKNDRGKAEVVDNLANRSSQENTAEERKINMNELRQKLEQTVIAGPVMAPASGKKRTLAGDRVFRQKPDKLSQKLELPFKPSQKPQKPDKLNPKPDKPTQKPDKPIQNLENSNLSVVKELLQRKHASSDSLDGASRPEPVAKISRGHSDSDVSSEQPKEDRRIPLPLPRGDKPHVVLSENSEYSEPYEFIKGVTMDLRRSYSDTGEFVLGSPPRVVSEQGVSCNDDGNSVKRRTITHPKWIGDDDAYAYVGGGPTGYNQELAPDGSDSENNAPNDQDLVVIRRTKLLPEWLDDEDPYAILGGKPQITDSVGVEEKEKGKTESDNCVYSVKTQRQHRKQLIDYAVYKLASASDNDTFPFQENPPDTSVNPPALSSSVIDSDPSKSVAVAGTYSCEGDSPAPSFSPPIQPDEYPSIDSGLETESERNLDNPKKTIRSRSEPFEQPPKLSKIPDRSFSLTPTVDNVYEEVAFGDGHFNFGKTNEESLPDLPKKGQNSTLDIQRGQLDSVPPDLPPRSPIDPAPRVDESRSAAAEPQLPELSSTTTSLNQSPNTQQRNTTNPFLAALKSLSPTKQLATFFPSLVQGPDHPTDECSSPQVPHKPPSIQPPNGASATWHDQDSGEEDFRPPVPTKSFEEDRRVVPARSMPEIPDLGRSNEPSVKDTRGGKFKFSFATLKSKFQGSSTFGYPNRIDKPKGPRRAPWSTVG